MNLGHPPDWAALLETGQVVLPDALAEVREATVVGGARDLQVRMAGGLAFDVLPDRGLDIGAAWWGAMPLAWRSPNLVDPGPGFGWEERFLGGLLATCGPDNIGAPLLRPGARLVVAAGEPVLREPCPPGRDPLVAPAPAPGLEPVVAEHPLTGTGSTARAAPTGTGHGVEVVVEWTAETLPRLCTWSWPACDGWVLGVGPTNAPLFGPERDGPYAGAPVLAPGATWTTGVRIGVRPEAEGPA